MEAPTDNRTVVVQQITRVGKDEVRAVTPDIRTILKGLSIPNLTGSLTIHVNRGGICEISFTTKS